MRKLFLFILLLAVSFVTEAQFKGGFYVGINGSQVDGDNYVGYYKLGLNIGPTAMYPISKRFDAAFEILYSQKGSQSKIIEGFPRQLFFKLDYIEVPILINFHAPNTESFKKDKDQKLDKVILTAGLSIARMVNDTLDRNPIPGYPNNLPEDVFFRPNHLDFNLILGGAYQLTDHWQINIRYNYSITPIGFSSNSRSRNQGLYNNLVSFRIGYIIQGKAK
jgi:hypothetical protein